MAIEVILREQWAKVLGWPNYEISTSGQVRRNGKPVVTFLVRGYAAFNVSDGSRRKSLRVHRQMLLAFKGESNLESRHLNGIKTENRIGNLHYGTRLENEQDKRLHGTLMTGERNHQSKLTKIQVIEIRSSTVGSFALARKYGVHPGTIWKIRTGRAWRI